MLQIGWGRAEFTPEGPAPLAGYAHARERKSQRVRDPLLARAVAFDDGDTRAVVVIYDLLMVVEDLARGVRQRLHDARAFVMVHATHTHSSVGGYAPGLLGRLFAGGYRPESVPRLIQAGERAAREALEGLRPAEVRAASTILPGLNGNRRDPSGPRDEELTVVRLARGKEIGVLVSYPAHPVIVGERDHHAVSADFPGEVVRLLERDVAFAAFVQGSLGGVDVLFPQDPGVTADRNLSLMAEPLAHSAMNLARLATRCSPAAAVQVASEEWDLPRPDPRPFFEDQGAGRILGRPLSAVLGLLVPRSIRTARVQGIRVGSFAIVGTPADLGVRIGLAIKRHARAVGIEHPVAASQCDGYIGYLHRAEDYRVTPPPSHRKMAYYENAMSFFGHGAGERTLAAACRVVERLGPGGQPDTGELPSVRSSVQGTSCR